MLNNTLRSEQDLSGCYMVCGIGCRWESVISEVEHGKCSPEWHKIVCVVRESIYRKDDLWWQSNWRHRAGFVTDAKGAFTPDANQANKSRYSHVVGRVNILPWTASFARENSLDNRREFASWEGILPGSFSVVAKWLFVIMSLLEQAPDLLTWREYPPKFRFFNSNRMSNAPNAQFALRNTHESHHSRRLIRANSAAGLSITSLHWLNM